jgi:hypothetical protein
LGSRHAEVNTLKINEIILKNTQLEVKNKKSKTFGLPTGTEKMSVERAEN